MYSDGRSQAVANGQEADVRLEACLFANRDAYGA